MKSTDLQRRKTRAQLARKGAWAHVDSEFVTDTILQVVVNVDVSKDRMSEAAWLLALAVDIVAFEFDRELPPSFMAFTFAFQQAWTMVCCRPRQERKKAANIHDLPPFLGGS